MRLLSEAPFDIRTYFGNLVILYPEGRGELIAELRERLDEVEKGKEVYVICQSGLRSYIACRILEESGYEAYNFAGGFRFYDAVTNDRCLIESATACGMDQ